MVDQTTQAEIDAVRAENIELRAQLKAARGGLADIFDGEPQWPDKPKKELMWCRKRAKEVYRATGDAPLGLGKTGVYRDRPDPIGCEEGETCGRYDPPDEDAPRGWKPKPCQGVMEYHENDDHDVPTVWPRCDTCGEIGE